MSHQRHLLILIAACWLCTALAVEAAEASAATKPPNVVVVLTDDQGFGDMGFNGNPIVRTPHLDAMASRSATLANFYVCPACTPTRAGLMTGRYNFRTRAIDTFQGRAMMDPGEVTVGELLQRAGYATGIFGKWHLGDTYPLRAMDQGFEESLVHRGGGIAQPSDPPGGEGKYTDPVLFRNGKPAAMKGYCTDVYFSEGIRWADREARKGRPFFLYLATNAPHDPYHDVPLDKLEYYKKQTITPDRYPKTAGHAVRETLNADHLARVYAMIENIDDNVGRLFAWLDREKLTDNTLVLFLTDNGPWTWGYNAGWRDHKTSVYEGGIRSPLLAHWPGKLQPGVCSDRIAANIDVMPTILEVCGVPVPQGLKLDGRSLVPLWKRQPGNWPDRTLFFQMHRGDRPVRYHNCAARTQRWKLVHATGFGTETFQNPLKLELFDMAADPYETRDVAAEHPEIVADLRRRYDQWFDDVGSTRPDNYAPLRIPLGTPHENPVVLTRQDWRGTVPRQKPNGHWLVNVTAAGSYDVTFRFKPIQRPATARFELGAVKREQPVREGTETVVFKNVSLPAGPDQLEAYLAVNNETIGVMFVEVLRQRRTVEEPVGAARRPNIIVVLADDLGYGDVRCYDPERAKVPTPHIDRLAEQGMRFTDAHTSASLCSPSRYGLLTGRFSWRTPMRTHVVRVYGTPLIAADRLTLPRMLQQQGYHTACFGKWHLGWDWPLREKDGSIVRAPTGKFLQERPGEPVFEQPIQQGPTTRGFDYYFGVDVPNFPPYTFLENDRMTVAPTERKTVNDRVHWGPAGPMAPGWQFDRVLPTIVEKTEQYLAARAQDKKPFFVYMPLTSPHEPIAPSKAFQGKSGISDVADFIMETDAALGRVMDALQRHGLADNTLLVFTSDNGHCSYTGLSPFVKAGHRVGGPYRPVSGVHYSDYYHRKDLESPIGCFSSSRTGIMHAPRGTTASTKSSLDDFARHCASVDPKKWIDLHIYARLDKERAIAMKGDVVGHIRVVLDDLAPVFLETTTA